MQCSKVEVVENSSLVGICKKQNINEKCWLYIHTYTYNYTYKNARHTCKIMDIIHACTILGMCSKLAIVVVHVYIITNKNIFGKNEMRCKVDD